VVFRLNFGDRPNPATEALLHDCLGSAVAGYIGQYGDKTQVIEPSTGKPMIPHHYLLRRQGREFEIEVFGATGHMGAIRERDGAITKMAHLVRSLVFSKARIEAVAGTPVSIELAPVRRRKSHRNSALVLEGGQGFVPTHKIEEVMQRIRTAAQRGAGIYLNRLGRPERGNSVVEVTYEKLHNVAFDGDPNSTTVLNALAAARVCDLPKQEPVLGWTVSCDARLFATEYPGLPVLTFGPGELVHAHSDQEQIRLDDIRKAAEFLALFLLRETGTAR
jgi:acetylornithine deacetylase/succinyl-diaminopimelate desuccinylase-like protein